MLGSRAPGILNGFLCVVQTNRYNRCDVFPGLLFQSVNIGDCYPLLFYSVNIGDCNPLLFYSVNIAAYQKLFSSRALLQ